MPSLPNFTQARSLDFEHEIPTVLANLTYLPRPNCSFQTYKRDLEKLVEGLETLLLAPWHNLTGP